jgi:hypothetical protein
MAAGSLSQPCSMIYEPHRGVYEFLWSEHKYNVMAVSYTDFTSVATRLGKKIKILSLLKKLGKCAFEERKENYRALLNAYMHIKEFLGREQQETVVRAILEDEAEAACLIYQGAMSNFERALPGCRYFFNAKHGVNKFWDSQGNPGLWVCFGPYQMHLSTEQVFQRIAVAGGVENEDLLELLRELRRGVPMARIEKLSAALVKALRDNNAMAEPGEKMAYLNPRIKLELCHPKPEPIIPINERIYISLILEHLIDNAEYPPEMLGICPDIATFSLAAEELVPSFFEMPRDFSLERGHGDLAAAFAERLRQDNGAD